MEASSPINGWHLAGVIFAIFCWFLFRSSAQVWDGIFARARPHAEVFASVVFYCLRRADIERDLETGLSGSDSSGGTRPGTGQEGSAARPDTTMSGGLDSSGGVDPGTDQGNSRTRPSPSGPGDSSVAPGGVDLGTDRGSRTGPDTSSGTAPSGFFNLCWCPTSLAEETRRHVRAARTRQERRETLLAAAAPMPKGNRPEPTEINAVSAANALAQ